LLNSYSKGVRQFYLTNGKAPSYVANFDYIYRVENPEITCLDSTGSGDAFFAGIVYGHYKDLVFDEFLPLATALGSLNASRFDVCNVPPEDALTLSKQVVISPVGKKMKLVDVTLRDKFTFFIVFFLALSFRLQPQILSSISIQGNSAFSDETYLRWIDLPPRSSLFPGYRDTVQNRISEYLSANGYFFSEIDSIAPLFSDDSSRASLQLFLKEGPLAIIRSLKFTGADTSSSPELIQLYQEVYSLLEEPFVPVQFEQLISLYIDELEKQVIHLQKLLLKVYS
jgi:hypothetical protein